MLLHDTARRSPDGEDTASAWLSPGRMAGLLALLTLAAYPQVILGLQTFVYRDFGYFSCPAASYFRDRFWQGEIPLWNPLNNCGTPFLGQWNTLVLYPPSIFYLLFPPSLSLGLFSLAHLVLGGWGMYLLASRWTQDRFAAAFAGVVFAFNGLALNSLTLPSAIAGLSWMPWVVRFTEQAWRKGGTRLVGAAFVGTLQMLSGAVETILLTWVLLGLLVAADVIRGDVPRGKTILRTGLVVVLITCLSAAQLLPFFDLLIHSHRLGRFDAAEWPMPKTGWLNFLLPIFRCRSFQDGVFMQPGQNWTTSYYVGAATVALAALAVWRWREWRVWLLALAVAAALVLALGDATPVYRWLRQHAGVVALMRYPVKFVIVPVFVLPLLAAYGLAGRPDGPAGRTVCFGKPWYGIASVVIGLLLAMVWWTYRFQEPGDEGPAICLNGALRAVLFVAVAGCVICIQRIPDPRLHRCLQLFVLLLVWFDLYRQAPQPSTVKPAIYAPNPARFASARPAPGVARAMLPPSAQAQFYSSYLPDLAEDYISRRFALLANCNLLDNVPKCDGFFPLDLGHYGVLSGDDAADPLLDFLGVSQLMKIEGNTFNWQSRSTFMPVLTIGQAPVFASEPAALQGVTSTNFNPLQIVFLPLEAKSSLTATGTTAATIRSGRFSSETIVATTESDVPAVLVIAQAYYHPWRAAVDGKPAPLWRANYAFQALEVPAGAHQVTLRYVDTAFRSGTIISITALAGCLAFYFRRRRRDGAG